MHGREGRQACWPRSDRISRHASERDHVTDRKLAAPIIGTGSTMSVSNSIVYEDETTRQYETICGWRKTLYESPLTRACESFTLPRVQGISALLGLQSPLMRAAR